MPQGQLDLKANLSTHDPQRFSDIVTWNITSKTNEKNYQERLSQIADRIAEMAKENSAPDFFLLQEAPTDGNLNFFLDDLNKKLNPPSKNPEWSAVISEEGLITLYNIQKYKNNINTSQQAELTDKMHRMLDIGRDYKILPSVFAPIQSQTSQAAQGNKLLVNCHFDTISVKDKLNKKKGFHPVMSMLGIKDKRIDPTDITVAGDFGDDPKEHPEVTIQSAAGTEGFASTSGKFQNVNVIALNKYNRRKDVKEREEQDVDADKESQAPSIHGKFDLKLVEGMADELGLTPNDTKTVWKGQIVKGDPTSVVIMNENEIVGRRDASEKALEKMIDLASRTSPPGSQLRIEGTPEQVKIMAAVCEARFISYTKVIKKEEADKKATGTKQAAMKEKLQDLRDQHTNKSPAKQQDKPKPASVVGDNDDDASLSRHPKGPPRRS